MKVAIMTWYQFNNYGSKLQAIAMKELLQKYGHKAVFINYKPRGTISLNNNFISNVKEISNKIKGHTINKTLSNNEFEIFSKKHIQETDRCDSYVDLYQLNKKFDAFICGSDQIWSPNNFDPRFFLDFASVNKIMSYAPSIGLNKIDSQEISIKMKQLLNRFRYISVREKTGAQLINEITGKKVDVVLDPTLLLNYDDWTFYENKKLSSKLLNEKYIVTYFLGCSKKYIKNIENFAQKNNFKIYNIPVYNKRIINKYNMDISIGPDSFISLIKNASYIFTDSFHGMAFSINFNKEFYVFKRFSKKSNINQNSRIIDLLKSLDIDSRIVDNKCNFFEKKINYDIVNNKINIMRKSSFNYLTKSLNEIEKKCNTFDKTDSLTPYCTGCGACASICPVGAITIEKNEEGFYSYNLNNNKCIKCGLCKEVCPMINLDTNNIDESKKLLAFKSNEYITISKSSSGGFANTIAMLFNNKGFYVCGCIYDNEFDLAKHIIVEPYKEEELDKLQGSKYIQSNSSSIIKKCIELGKNNKILFIGTPCQVACFDKLTKRKNIRDNFILVDLICHGVPSYLLWNKYLHEKFDSNKELKNNHNIVIRNSLLTKKNRYMQIKICDKNGKIVYIKNQTKDNFYKLFNDGTCFNKACFECPYRTKSSADIRIGDYWGEKYSKGNKSTSMVIPITPKGLNIIDMIKKNKHVLIVEEKISDYFEVQYPYNKNIPLYRDELINDLKDNSISLKKICNKYCKHQNFINKIYKFKKIIKK